MPTEDLKSLVRRWYEDYNKGSLNPEQYLAPNFVDHTPLPGQAPGIQGVKDSLNQLRKAFPDGRFTVEDIIAEGEKVTARVTFRATHRGEFFGIPATNKRVEFTSIDTLRVSGGKVMEYWGNPDLLGLMQQLGAIRMPQMTPQR